MRVEWGEGPAFRWVSNSEKGAKENVWERGHRTHIPVPDGAQPREGRVRLPGWLSGLGRAEDPPLRRNSLRDVEQGRPPESETRHCWECSVETKLGNPAQLLCS